ncbi:hypothetical protein FKM82_007593 [Ascaphus truei]
MLWEKPILRNVSLVSLCSSVQRAVARCWQKNVFYGSLTNIIKYYLRKCRICGITSVGKFILSTKINKQEHLQSNKLTTCCQKGLHSIDTEGCTGPHGSKVDE